MLGPPTLPNHLSKVIQTGSGKPDFYVDEFSYQKSIKNQDIRLLGSLSSVIVTLNLSCVCFFGMAKLKCLIVLQDPWLISRCWLKSTRFIRKSRSSCAKNPPQLPGERSHRRARGGRSFPQRGKQLVPRSRDTVTGRWRYKVRRCQQ